jgi:hypothetical protein
MAPQIGGKRREAQGVDHKRASIDFPTSANGQSRAAFSTHQSLCRPPDDVVRSGATVTPHAEWAAERGDNDIPNG